MQGAWPSLARSLYNNHSRYEEVYFTPFKGYYFTGDGARRDEVRSKLYSDDGAVETIW